MKRKENMANQIVEIDVQKLFESGAHFGHRTSRWNPKMAKYIHSKKKGIHIIDLEKTADCLKSALDYIYDAISKGQSILLVGTKPQSRGIVQEVAQKTGMPYISKRWLGGTLTNWNTISSQIRKLKELESKIVSGAYNDKLNKLEIQRIQEKVDDLNDIYSGIKEMNGLPSIIFVVDAVNDHISINEANKLNIPIVAIVDTNADPTRVTYPIPANDDSLKSISLILSYLEATILSAKSKVKKTN